MKWNHIDFPKNAVCCCRKTKISCWSAVFEPNNITHLRASLHNMFTITTHFLWCECVYTIHIGPNCVTSLIHSSIVCITAKLALSVCVCVCALMYLHIFVCVWVCMRMHVFVSEILLLLSLALLQKKYQNNSRPNPKYEYKRNTEFVTHTRFEIWPWTASAFIGWRFESRPCHVHTHMH